MQWSIVAWRSAVQQYLAESSCRKWYLSSSGTCAVWQVSDARSRSYSDSAVIQYSALQCSALSCIVVLFSALYSNIVYISWQSSEVNQIRQCYTKWLPCQHHNNCTHVLYIYVLYTGSVYIICTLYYITPQSHLTALSIRTTLN